MSVKCNKSKFCGCESCNHAFTHEESNDCESECPEVENSKCVPVEKKPKVTEFRIEMKIINAGDMTFEELQYYCEWIREQAKYLEDNNKKLDKNFTARTT
jgi:hypothetical protein